MWRMLKEIGWPTIEILQREWRAEIPGCLASTPSRKGREAGQTKFGCARKAD